MSDNRERTQDIHFMVTLQEKEMILQQMKNAGTTNMGAYLRKMSVDGYVLQLDLSEVRELVRLLRTTSNSLNQLAKRANETGSIYIEDIEDLKLRYSSLWNSAEQILLLLASI